MAETRTPDAKNYRPWDGIPDVPMRAPGRGEKAVAVERQSIEQAGVIQQQQAQITELQNVVQQQASQIERLEALVGTQGQQIAGVWGKVVERLGIPT